jgi:hypothetical protein
VQVLGVVRVGVKLLGPPKERDAREQDDEKRVDDEVRGPRRARWLFRAY